MIRGTEHHDRLVEGGWFQIIRKKIGGHDRNAQEKYMLSSACYATKEKHCIIDIEQGFGSGSAWIRISLSCWIRIRI
jgi:hypothetical protein